MGARWDRPAGESVRRVMLRERRAQPAQPFLVLGQTVLLQSPQLWTGCLQFNQYPSGIGAHPSSCFLKQPARTVSSCVLWIEQQTCLASASTRSETETSPSVVAISPPSAPRTRRREGVASFRAHASKRAWSVVALLQRARTRR
jgi:hypothetical protein